MLLADDDDVVKAPSPHRSDHLRAHFAKTIELRSGGLVSPWL
jgi:hypothetical protein